MKTNKYYLLWLLTVLLSFNYMDRFALGVVLQDIKIDLHLSDTQLGLLSGIAFALFYSVLGVPIARWADRGNRVTIISLSIALWSVAVTLCGAARSFVQLMLIRVVVGVGESGCVPASLSLIAGFFTRDERPRAVSFYMQGISASVLIGYFAAGWLNELFGWRVMFVMIGLPGIGLTLLARWTIKEAPDRLAELATAAPSPWTFREVCLFLLRSATFRHMLYCCAVNWFFTYGIMQWTPAFFVRSFALKTGELGTWLAAIYGGSFIIGTYLGGEWVTRFALRNEKKQLRAMAIITTISGVLAALVYVPVTAPNFHLGFMWLTLSMLTGTSVSGPQFALIQALVPSRMQAVAIAVVYLVGNLIGIGLGPWAAGALSDAFRPWVADQSLRYALLVLCPVCVWSAWHFWAAGKTVARDLGHVHGIEEDDQRGAAMSRTDVSPFPLVASE